MDISFDYDRKGKGAELGLTRYVAGHQSTQAGVCPRSGTVPSGPAGKQSRFESGLSFGAPNRNHAGVCEGAGYGIAGRTFGDQFEIELAAE